jgi:hypothetical protein
MIRRKSVSPISAVIAGGFRIKGQHEFFGYQACAGRGRAKLLP